MRTRQAGTLPILTCCAKPYNATALLVSAFDPFRTLALPSAIWPQSETGTLRLTRRVETASILRSRYDRKGADDKAEKSDPNQRRVLAEGNAKRLAVIGPELLQIPSE